MSSTIVRYELDPARLDEHLALIDAVFEHLADSPVPGVHYEVLRSAEEMEFTHIATFADDAARQAFGASPAFAAFTENIGDRCITPPAPVDQIHVHDHRS